MTTAETIVELNGLIQTCRDGELGYGAAATDARNTELEAVFTGYAKQRGLFARNLQAEVRRLGGDPERSGTTGGTLLRGWMDLKSSLTRASGAAILGTCETGEEVAVAAFTWVVGLTIPGQTRVLVERQCKSIREAQARLMRLKASVSAGSEKNDSA
jgi:uncharacterized protein (TIGR02284 family)